jgi:hypothetical protein
MTFGKQFFMLVKYCKDRPLEDVVQIGVGHLVPEGDRLRRIKVCEEEKTEDTVMELCKF